jgi:Ca-activated chloride channel family protein
MGEVFIWLMALVMGATLVVGPVSAAPPLPLPVGPGGSETPETADKTLSPYFFVKSDDPSLDQLPLKSTSAQADIAGVIADVTVTQVYKNEGKRAIEAVYIFPASTRAAVYAMKMTVGERTITAEIQKREEARAAYEKAKQEGKTASLLEQQRPNVFQMNVANILPGDEIRTELRYTELIAPTDGVYELVYPTVVGPRYSSQPAATAPPSEKWVENPYLHSGEAAPYSFDIKVRLAAGMPIQEMTCTSHKVDIQYDDPSRARVDLSADEKSGGNRDFILKYRLAGDKIQTGLLLYEGEKEKFFLLMVQPPKRHTQSAIPPREYIFIVDVSGSMHGFPLDISKKLLKDLIGGLRPTDQFNVLLFAGGSQIMAERSVPATAENIRRATDLIEHQTGGGGTELLPALKRALALPRTEGVSRSVVIATDGYVAVETEAFDLIRKDLGQANFFTFGIGSSVNRFLLEGMARVGAGEPFVITKPDQAPAQAEKFRRYIESPLLTGIGLDFGKFQAYDVVPPAIPDVFAERPVIVFGKWREASAGSITLRGKGGDKPYEQSIDASTVKPLQANSALRYLWARSRIAELSDYNHLRADDDRIARITRLGLDYNLLTAYTSFVAIDKQVRRKDGEVTTVKQPLPLPEGVSDYAVGGVGGAAGTMAMRAGRPMPAPYPASGAAPPSVAEQDSRVMKHMNKEVVSEGERKAEEGERKITLRVKSVEATPGLSKAAIKQAVDSQMHDLMDCLARVRRSQLTKQMKITLQIDGSGKVSDVKLGPLGKTPEDTAQCLKDGIEDWIFDAPKGNAPVKVTLTLSVS